ncbi:MAG TPA: M48 family metallopeptidase [Azoarcus sp.]|nr:M48 family metallopeptidase [Azoarcus sp.]
MDFFGAQEQARKNTRWLVLWFALAVIGIAAAVYIALLFGTQFTQNVNPGAYQTGAQAGPPSFVLWNPELLGWTLVGVGGLIFFGSLYKYLHLARNGGAKIARELGGRLVSRDSQDLHERQLINIVDEMAIAAGIPSPPVFVLDAENSINAFAAGARPSEAVVAVTRGTLERLNRDELQGVIAHEFSHILNGDMRLNLRLVAVLYGILLLTLGGRILLYSARGRNGAPLALGGLVLIIVGSVGMLGGRIIQASVSRQREFLADASAVQFTRNPQGIAGALSHIAGFGSKIEHPRAVEASHMFFGSRAKLAGLMATHPPIEERIQRIDPDWKNRQRSGKEQTRSPVQDSAAPLGAAGFASGFSQQVGTVRPEHLEHSQSLLAALPATLIDSLHRPRGARATVFALLLSRDTAVRERQLAELETRFGPDVRNECARLSAEIASLPAGYRLPLLDLALPALSQFVGHSHDEIIQVADELIAADGRTSSFEYVSRRLLRAVLLPDTANQPLRSPSLRALRKDAGLVLSLLASAGHADETEARAAFDAAALVAPLEGLEFQPRNRRYSTAHLDEALTRLAATTPAFRRAFIDACASAVMHDGVIDPTEMELLRAFCQALDAPVPVPIP